jgi:hypothetical protein
VFQPSCQLSTDLYLLVFYLCNDAVNSSSGQVTLVWRPSGKQQITYHNSKSLAEISTWDLWNKTHSANHSTVMLLWLIPYSNFASPLLRWVPKLGREDLLYLMLWDTSQPKNFTFVKAEGMKTILQQIWGVSNQHVLPVATPVLAREYGMTLSHEISNTAVLCPKLGK